MTNVNVQRLHNFSGHRQGIYALQPADKPHLFFSGSADGMVVLWNLQNPDEGNLIAQVPNPVFALHYYSESDFLIVGHNYNGIHVLDWKNKKEVGSLQLTTEKIFDIQSNGSRLWIGDGAGMMVVVDLKTMSVVNRMEVSARAIRCIAINPHNGEIAVGCSDNHIRILDLETHVEKYAWEAHLNSVFTLAYTPDGKYLLSGSRDARLKVWDVGTGYLKAAEVIAHLFTINHLDFSPDSKHFVTCSMDKSIKVWNLDDLRLLKVIDKGRHAGHGTSVNKVLWTSYQSQLVSASDDRTISVWNIDFSEDPAP